MSELEVMLAAMALGLPMPLNVIQLLWHNLVTDVLPALMLAQEPPEADVLRRQPRDAAEPMLPRGERAALARESAVLAAGTLASYLYGLRRYGPGRRAQTHAFLTLTLSQLLHAFGCRSPERHLFRSPRLAPNRGLTWSVAGLAAAELALVAAPPLRSLFKLSPLGLSDLGVVLGTSVVPLLVNDRLKPQRADAPTREETIDRRPNA